MKFTFFANIVPDYGQIVQEYPQTLTLSIILYRITDTLSKIMQEVFFTLYGIGNALARISTEFCHF